MRSLLTLLIASSALADVSVKDFPYNAAGNGVADDAAAIQAAIDSNDSLILFPPGIYRITSRVCWGDSQTLRGSGIANGSGSRGTLIFFDATSGSALRCGRPGEFARNARIENMRIRGSGNTYSTIGVEVGDPGEYYSANTFGMRDVWIERFGVGFDNNSADASFLSGGCLAENGINGRTTSNDFLQVRSVNNTAATICGWHVMGGGSGLHVTGSVSSAMPVHFRCNTGAILRIESLWFESAPGGTTSWIEAGTNSVLLLELCHLMRDGSTIPFISGYGGFLKFSMMRGGTNVFNYNGGPQIIGEGEQGILNTFPYTATSY